MILRIEKLKDVCSSILPAVDSNSLSSITETLELKVVGTSLFLCVTNKEYYAKVELDVGEAVDFHATVDAELFLKLVSQTTSDTIELLTDTNNLILKGNGTYKLPLIFDADKLLELPEINIDNVTVEFDMEGDLLNSILVNNTKQLSIGTISKLVQKMYYVDEQGALTFTTGACVNNFTLPQPVKMLLNQRLVKLFKLFKGEKVHFKLGHDAITDEITQTKVMFNSNNICITAILSCDDTMINSVPVSAIRNRTTTVYPYSISVNKQDLMECINRMRLYLLSSKTTTALSKCIFDKGSVTISDLSNENKEEVLYNNQIDALDAPYEMIIDLNDLFAVLDTCFENHVQISFGDHQAVTVSRANIINVIPEVRS